MPQADGSIRIDTTIDSRNLPSQMQKVVNQIKKLENEASRLRAHLENVANTKIPTKEYTEVQKQIEDTEKKLALLQERKERFFALGGSENSKAFQSMQYDIEQLQSSLPFLKTELQELVEDGKAFTLGSDTEEFEKTSQKLKEVEGNIDVAKKRLEEMYAKQKPVKEQFDKISKAAQNSGDSIKKSFQGGLKTILKYGFGIRSLYVLVNKVRSAIKDGFSNLSESGVGDFKSQIDDMNASLTMLKNSFASAFAPIVTAVIPYIKQLVDWISIALDKLAMFNALITGQQKYARAVKQTAGALKDAGKAAKGYLSPLDEINKYQEKDTGGDSGDKSDMFEEIPVDNNVGKWLQEILEYANQIKETFKQGFADGLGDISPRIDSIKNSFSSIKTSLSDIFTDSSVLSSADGFVQSIINMFGNLAGAVTSIGITIATNLVGGIAQYLEENSGRIKEYLISMFDIWTDVSELYSSFFESFAYVFEAFSSEEGQGLTANLIGIFSDAFMGITELASEVFRDIVNVIIQPFTDNKEAFRTALEGYLGVLEEVTGTIKQGIDDTFSKLLEVYDEHIKPFFDSIADGLSELTEEFLEFWNGNVQPILDEWAEEFDRLWAEYVQPVFDNIIGLIGDVADCLKSIWEKWIKPLISWIISNVLPKLLPIFNSIKSNFTLVFKVISTVINTIVNIIRGVIRTITSLINGDWKGAWNNAKKIVTDIWDGIKKIIKDVVDWILDKVGGIIDFFGGVGSKISGFFGGDTSTTYTVQTQSIDSSNIPGYATGQVIPRTMRQHLAIMGDNPNETEVVSPLSTMKQAMVEAMTEMGLAGNNGSPQTIIIKQYLDGNQVAKSVVNAGKLEQMSSGNNMFLLGNA